MSLDSKEIIDVLSNILTVKNDEELLEASDEKSLKEHSKNYDTILLNYTSYLEKILNSKRIMKNFFFWMSFSIMIICILCMVILIFVAISLANNENFDITNYIIPFCTSIISFLTVFMIIPKIIAKYLFNNNEEAVMQTIIASIQEYDKYIRTQLTDKNDEEKENSNNENVE